MELSLKSILTRSTHPRFSFTCGGKGSDELLGRWASQADEEKIDDTRDRRSQGAAAVSRSQEERSVPGEIGSPFASVVGRMTAACHPSQSSPPG